MFLCKKCGKEHDGSYGSGKFCSSKCAHSRKISQETKAKISTSLNEYYNKEGKKSDFNYSKKSNLPVLLNRTCEICGDKFYHKNYRKTCSMECAKRLREQLNERMKGNPRKCKYKEQKEWSDNSFKKLYKYYFTYKTTNIISGHYYFGIHITNNLEDGYLGSGVRLKQAIKKYGKGNFKREIINFYDCYKDLVQAEEKLIQKEDIQSTSCYNLTFGGTGGPSFSGKRHTIATKEKIRAKAKIAANSEANRELRVKRKKMAKLRSYVLYNIKEVIGLEELMKVMKIKNKKYFRSYFYENWGHENTLDISQVLWE